MTELHMALHIISWVHCLEKNRNKTHMKPAISCWNIVNLNLVALNHVMKQALEKNLMLVSCRWYKPKWHFQTWKGVFNNLYQILHQTLVQIHLSVDSQIDLRLKINPWSPWAQENCTWFSLYQPHQWKKLFCSQLNVWHWQNSIQE